MKDELMTPEFIERRATDYTQAKLYVISGLTLTIAVITAVVVLVVTAQPGQDRTATVAIVIGLLVPTLTGLYSMIKSSETSLKQDVTLRKVSEIGENVNGKMTQLLDAKGRVEHAAGRHQGVIEGVAAVTAAQADPAAVLVIPPAVTPAPPVAPQPSSGDTE
jgi:hypothetical protein